MSDLTDLYSHLAQLYTLRDNLLGYINQYPALQTELYGLLNDVEAEILSDQAQLDTDDPLPGLLSEYSLDDINNILLVRSRREEVAFGFSVVEKMFTWADKFDSDDSEKWNFIDVATDGGKLKYTPSGTGDGTMYSVGTYDLVDSKLLIHVEEYPADGFFTFAVTPTPGLPENSIQVGLNILNSQFEFFIYEGSSISTAGVVQGITLAPLWIQMAVDSSGSTLDASYSFDGNTWASLYSGTAPSYVSAVNVWMEFRDTGTGDWAVDNFNMPLGDVITHIIDEFTSFDSSVWSLEGTASVTGGELVLPVDGGTNRATSVGQVDMRNEPGCTFKLAEVADVSDTGTFAGLYFTLTDTSYPYGLVRVTVTQSEGVTSYVLMDYIPSGSGTPVSLGSFPYSAVSHLWFRLTKSGADRVRLQTSAEGTTWVTQLDLPQYTISVPMNAMRVAFECYGSGTGQYSIDSFTA